MTVRRWLCAHPSDVVDFFVYVVVLNLAVEYLPRVISEGFTRTLLVVALLLSRGAVRRLLASPGGGTATEVGRD